MNHWRLAVCTATVLILLWHLPANSQRSGESPIESLRTRDLDVLIENIEPEQDVVRVAIDAGHGGTDLGVRSAKSILEKNVTLKLARLIEKKLSEDEQIEIIDIRPEDVNIPVIDRIGHANSGGGDIYIGIHADGGASPRSHPWKIYINRGSGHAKEDVAGTKWEDTNNRFSENSAKLADIIAKQLVEMNPDRGVDIVKSDVLALGGLAMPAVIIELVDLSNPDDEILLEKDELAPALAKRVSTAITKYIKANGAAVNQEWQDE